jgi:hypothetical protein
MMRISDIEAFFNTEVQKKELREISFDKENNKSLINSTKPSFDFDVINDKIKTSDTIYFKDGKIIFVEFKNGKISEKDFRLKATESIISFYNFIFEKGFKEMVCFPSDLFQIYVVYNKNSSPSMLNTFSATEKKLQLQYKHFFSKYQVVDNENFKKIFGI